MAIQLVCENHSSTLTLPSAFFSNTLQVIWSRYTSKQRTDVETRISPSLIVTIFFHGKSVICNGKFSFINHFTKLYFGTSVAKTICHNDLPGYDLLANSKVLEQLDFKLSMTIVYFNRNIRPKPKLIYRKILLFTPSFYI